MTSGLNKNIYELPGLITRGLPGVTSGLSVITASLSGMTKGLSSITSGLPRVTIRLCGIKIRYPRKNPCGLKYFGLQTDT